MFHDLVSRVWWAYTDSVRSDAAIQADGERRARQLARLAEPSPLHPSYQPTYARALERIVDAHELLGDFKTCGWQQQHKLNDVFQLLEEAGEALLEISPNEVSKDLQTKVRRWTDG